MKRYIPFVITFILSTFTSLLILSLYHTDQTSEEALRTHYYTSQVATLESPHRIRKAISKGNDSFILVDVRSQQEYEMEHIVGAYNIPVYKDPDTSNYGDEERIVRDFVELQQANPEKKVIIYCYSASCMSGRKVGKMLAENDVSVKELGVGWNEWRYDWNMWNYPHEWDTTTVEDYVIGGTEPGTFAGLDDLPEGCSANRDLGC